MAESLHVDIGMSSSAVGGGGGDYKVCDCK